MLNQQIYFKEPDPQKIKAFLGDYKLIVLDEAQRIANIGLTLSISYEKTREFYYVFAGGVDFSGIKTWFTVC